MWKTHPVSREGTNSTRITNLSFSPDHALYLSVKCLGIDFSYRFYRVGIWGSHLCTGHQSANSAISPSFA